MAAPQRRRIRVDHDCEWRDEADRLRGELAELRSVVEQIRAEMESMKRRLLGPKSEKIKPIGHEVRAKVGVDPAAALEARLANAKLRSARVVTERVEHNGVNPLDYLSDVLMRVQDHPAAEIDHLLPHRWRPPSSRIDAACEARDRVLRGSCRISCLLGDEVSVQGQLGGANRPMIGAQDAGCVCDV